MYFFKRGYLGHRRKPNLLQVLPSAGEPPRDFTAGGRRRFLLPVNTDNEARSE